MGTLDLPTDALYGASTQRAIENFAISGYRMPIPLLHTLGLLKRAAATVNADLDKLSREHAKLIIEAADEVYRGQHDDQFPVDVFQTGSGTSTNMNANEVIANRANQIAGQPLGTKSPIHPNDHVNLGQSSNDVMPTVLNVSVAIQIREHLQPSLRGLRDACRDRASAFKDICKSGRTHLMDATPMTLGQEFSGYTAQIDGAIHRCERAIAACQPLAIGGTAVGTGAFTHPEFGTSVCAALNEELGTHFVEAPNHFASQSARDEAVEVAGIVATIAVTLETIANNIRLLASGPRCGIGELLLPALQPGSSIMPGKVNPVICESVVQVALYVRGLCASIPSAGAAGHLQLNTTIPLLAHSLHESIQLLANAATVFTEKCVSEIAANQAQCSEFVERSLMLATNLSAIIGYDKTAAIAKRAQNENKTLREVLAEEKLLDDPAIKDALDPQSML